MGRQHLLCTLLAAILTTPSLLAQIHHFDQARSSEQVELSSPAVRRAEPPPADAAAATLEERGDTLRAEKSYLDALDYYRAALAKKPSSAPLTTEHAAAAQISSPTKARRLKNAD